MRRIAERALSLFGIEPVRVSLLYHAYNTTFAVVGPDGDRTILHILRPPEESISEAQWRVRVESELWWLDQVRADLDLQLPLPVRTEAGEGTVAIKVAPMGQARFCTLFHWVDGRFLRQHFTPAHLEAVGHLTARLHRHSEHLHVPSWIERPRVDRADAEIEERVTQQLTDVVSDEAADVVRQVFQKVRRAGDELGWGPDAFGFIHADIHQGNYMFHKGQVRLIDFGDCGWGHYLYDLAVTISELVDLPHRSQLRAALLAGYRQVRHLSSAHEALIDTFVMLRDVQNLASFVMVREDPSYRTRAAQIEERVSALERLLHAGE